MSLALLHIQFNPEPIHTTSAAKPGPAWHHQELRLGFRLSGEQILVLHSIALNLIGGLLYLVTLARLLSASLRVVGF